MCAGGLKVPEANFKSREVTPAVVSNRASGAHERGGCGRTQTQYSCTMKPAVVTQIRVEPELRTQLEAVLNEGETLTDFVQASVRNAIAFRRVQTSFQARAQAASEAYHQTGVSVPVETVLKKLQSKLDAKRKKLGR